MKRKYTAPLFMILFFGLGFLVTNILNNQISNKQQTIQSRAQNLSPVQEAKCTNAGGECQTGKRDQIGRPCSLSDGVTQGVVRYNFCPAQEGDVRCCVPGLAPGNPQPNSPANSNTGLIVKLQGIGPNANIQNRIRTVFIKMYKNNSAFDNSDYEAQGTVAYEPGSGNFTNSNFNLGAVPTGTYQMVIQIEKYLDKQMAATSGSSSISITQGSKVDTAPVEMRAGDIAPGFRGDNSVNVIDYNALIGCLPGAPFGACINRNYADLNDDGKVDQSDLDLLMSNFGESGFAFQTDQFKCEPDPSCNSGRDTIQMCSLLCTKINKRS